MLIPFKQYDNENTITNININDYIDFSQMQFNLFYEDILIYFVEMLKMSLERISNETYVEFIIDNIIKENCIVMADELNSICIKSLIYDINERRLKNELKGESAEERYNNYNLLFKNKKFIKDFYKKYPVLEDIITKTVEKRLLLIEEIAERLILDKGKIEKEFNFNFDKVISINITSGDTHNNGKKVSLIKTNNKKIVYKPHSLSTDVLYNKIIKYINSINCNNKQLKYLRVIDKEKYGWQEFIDYKQCKSISEVESYFTKVGSLLAIFYSIGTTDIHFENIICSGEDPYIIDLETLIENRSLLNSPKTLEEKFSIVFNSSVISTGILPMKLKNSIFDFDISALCSEEEQKSKLWKVNILSNMNSDNIKFLEQEGIVSSSSNNNKVLLNNKTICALDYQNFIAKGFSDTYKLILDNRDAIINLIEKYISLNKIEVRQVLRATSVYVKFLEASLHPKYLKDKKDRNRVLSIIRSKDKSQKHSYQMQYEEEIKALENLDIPYFSCRLDSKDLLANNKSNINCYYNKTLMEILKDNLNRLSDTDLKKQLYFIRLSISTLAKNMWEETNNLEINGAEYFKEKNNILEHSKSIGDFLLDNAIWDESNTECTWLVQLIEGNEIKMGMNNFTLYEYGGTIAFLITLGEELGDNRYVDLALGALKTIERYFNHGFYAKNLSAYNGIGSLIYLYYKIYLIKKDLNYYLKYQQLVEDLYKINLPEDCEIDYVGGLSGLIVLLTNIYKYEEDELLLNTIVKMSNILLEKSDDCKLTGLAHGYSGIILALSKVSKILKDNKLDYSKYLCKITRLISLENTFYENKIENWLDLRKGQELKDNTFWCHGAAGILLCRCEVLNCNIIDSTILEEDIKKSIKKLLNFGFSKDKNHSLCHGIFGNVDILINASKITKSSELLEKAKCEAYNALNYIKCNSLKLGMNSTNDLMSFMLGISGIAYTLLRLNNPVIPSILSLEI